MDEAYYSISEFASLCKVSSKTLRHYDKVGLLNPSYKDCDTGYRYYTASQVFDMVLIKGLKIRGFGLKEIKSYMAEKNPLNLYSLYKERKLKLLKEAEKIKDALDMVTKRLSYFDDILLKEEEWKCASNKDFEIVSLEEKYVFCVEEKIKLNEAGISLLCNKLHNRAISDKIKGLSPLILIYEGESFSKGSVLDVGACTSVKKGSSDKRRLSSIYGGKYARAFYKGSQFELQGIYDKMTDKIRSMGLKYFSKLYIEYLISFFHTKTFDNISCNLYIELDNAN